MEGVLFIGTCRVHEPAQILRDLVRSAGITVSIGPYRVHNPAEVLELFELLRRPVDPFRDHLLSDGAFRAIVLNRNPKKLTRHTERLMAQWSRFGTIVIELSTRRLFRSADQTVGFFIKRDLEAYADVVKPRIAAGELAPVLASDITVAVLQQIDFTGYMKKIRAKIGADKRVIWLPHTNVTDPSPRFDIVRSTRQRVADYVREGAAALKDEFLDPTDVVGQFGMGAFRDGDDTAHFSQDALMALANRYSELIVSKSTRETI